HFLGHEVELAHQRGNGRGGGTAGLAVDGQGKGGCHAPRDSVQCAWRKLRKCPIETSETPITVSTTSPVPCGMASAPPMKLSPVMAVTKGAARRCVSAPQPIATAAITSAIASPTR